MPLIFDPTIPPPSAPVEVVSPDGMVRAILDPEWAGVLLRCDLSDLVPVPDHVSFFRSDGTAVRGGEYQWCPDGYGTAYDHEAPLGAATSWYAVPYHRGVAGPQTQAVGLVLPAPTTGMDDPSTWIKSLDDPALSMQLPIDSWPQFDYDTGVELVRVPGRSNPAGTFDVLSGATTTGKFLTIGAEQAERFMTLMQSGIVLFQTSPLFVRPSFYAMITTVSRADRARMEEAIFSWTLGIAEIDRPPTAGARNRIPGRSYNDRRATWPLYDDHPAVTYAEGAGPL